MHAALFVRSHRQVSVPLMALGAICLLSQSFCATDLFAQSREFRELTHARLQDEFAGWTPRESVSREQASQFKPWSDSEEGVAVVVRTEQGNMAKLLLSWAFRKGPDKPLPIVIIHRYVTYSVAQPKKEVTTAAGKDVMLFPGFHFDLDIGQVVPDKVGGDLTLDDKAVLKPEGNSKLAVLEPKPPSKDDSAETVDASGFTGRWISDADGRWKGVLELAENEDGELTGSWTSEETQGRYDIQGKVGPQPHLARWTITLANAAQTVDVCLFTKEPDTMAGTIQLQGQKFGFVAKRERSEKSK